MEDEFKDRCGLRHDFWVLKNNNDWEVMGQNKNMVSGLLWIGHCACVSKVVYPSEINIAEL